MIALAPVKEVVSNVKPTCAATEWSGADEYTCPRDLDQIGIASGKLHEVSCLFVGLSIHAGGLFSRLYTFMNSTCPP